MKLRLMRPTIVTELVLALLCIWVVEGNCRPWHGQADDLPGMSTKTLVITTAVLVAVAVFVVIVAKKAGGTDDEEPAPADSTDFGLINRGGLGHSVPTVMSLRGGSCAAPAVNEADSRNDRVEHKMSPALTVNRNEQIGFGITLTF